MVMLNCDAITDMVELLNLSGQVQLAQGICASVGSDAQTGYSIQIGLSSRQKAIKIPRRWRLQPSPQSHLTSPLIEGHSSMPKLSPRLSTSTRAQRQRCAPIRLRGGGCTGSKPANSGGPTGISLDSQIQSIPVQNEMPWQLEAHSKATQMRRLFETLFAGCARLTVRQLHGGLSRSLVLYAQSFDEQEAVLQLVESIRAVEPVQLELTNYRKDGSRFRNLLSLQPVRDSLGVYRYSIAVLADVDTLPQLELVRCLLPCWFDASMLDSEATGAKVWFQSTHPRPSLIDTPTLPVTCVPSHLTPSHQTSSRLVMHSPPSRLIPSTPHPVSPRST